MTQTGTLSIDTLPTGANISIIDTTTEDVIFTGITPLVTVDIPPGDYSYNISMEGYQGIVNTFIITSNMLTDLGIITLSLYPTGDVFITSIPPGAKISINDEETDLITPAKITGLPLGIHTYELELSGYMDVENMFAIMPGITTEIFVNLIPTEGIVNISSTPPGAKIFIDNIDQGARTPASITGLSDEDHIYRLFLPGHYDAIGMFEIEDEPVDINIALTPATGSLNISSIPSGATIFIDNIDQEITTPAMIPNLLEGSHICKIALPLYQEKEITFYIFRDQNTTITKRLIPEIGILYILSTPPGAKIFIDDAEQIGIITPAVIPNISSGVHTYKLILPGHLDKMGTFEIITGQTTTVKETMISTVQALTIAAIGTISVGAVLSSISKPTIPS